MSIRYFCIENPGEVDIDQLRLLGFSSKANADGTERKDLIGQFGSGAKYSFAQLARLNALPIIYSGLNRISLTLDTNDEILYNVSGPDSDKLGIIDKIIHSSVHKNFGQFDWNDPWYCLRDLICNAIDGAKDIAKTDQDMDDYSFSQNNKLEGTEGRTKVFIPINPMIGMAISGLSENFVFHIKEVEANTQGRILDLGNNKIFKKGVFVRIVPNICWNYDLSGLKLNESRTASIEAIENAIEAYRHYGGIVYWTKVIEKVVNWSNSSGSPTDVKTTLTKPFEARLSYWCTNQNIKHAFDKLYPKGVICDTDASTEKMQKLTSRGFTVIIIKSYEFYHLLKRNKVICYDDITLKSLLMGDQLEELEEQYQSVVDEILIKVFKDEPKIDLPEVRVNPKMESNVKGMYLTVSEFDKPLIVFNKDYVGDNIDFRITIVEEFAHHFSKKKDDNRAFMDYIIKLLIKVMD